MNKISFKSNIYIVPIDKFFCMPTYDFKDKGKIVSYPWTDRETVRHKDECITNSASVCNAGGITDTLDVTMYHYFPCIGIAKLIFPYHTPEKLETDSKKLVEGFKETKLNGILTGGRYNLYTNNEEENLSSMHIFKMLLNMFKSKKIDFSILWGNGEGTDTSLYYTSKGRTLIDENNKPVLNILPDSWVVCPDGIKVKNPDDLKLAYKIIKISQTDKLIIDGYNNNRPVSKNKILNRIYWV